MQTNQLESIIEKFSKEVKERIAKLYRYLQSGKLMLFEEELYVMILGLYNELAHECIAESAKSEELEMKAKVIAQKKGLGELKKSTANIQLRTGFRIKVFSWFATRNKSKRKKGKRGPNGSGSHLLLHYWGCIKKASPEYYSQVAMLAVICPSLETAVKVLSSQYICGDYKRVRDIANAVGEICQKNRVEVSLEPGETVAGKRVIISIDGGRTRIREKNYKKYEYRRKKTKRTPFDTPWREPKLFVIHTLDEKGKVKKTDLPIYDLVVGKQKADELFDVLRMYLKQLQIHKAKEVFVIADGATWIWDRVDQLLFSLNVDEQKITQAIDFYHAVGHLNDLVNTIYPDECIERKQFFAYLKKSLKRGRINKIESWTKIITKEHPKRQSILSQLEYFRKHKHRMQYYCLKKAHLPRGSGIIESAIRRIVNLRFKSPTSFWTQDRVERMIFLRGLFLAHRWDNAMSFLACSNSCSRYCSHSIAA